ncbi:hypothetical protein OS493_018725 [Desmophyllum pertusum]|uniref:MYND-type domain-containing protein n=1 Tax=Desmophyllum pertusum TaxID=174260 RepID=A0A9X0D2P8_9CNID|nr:hypothetical protein OS493_018725 [Desmophyllum pertusum]
MAHAAHGLKFNPKTLSKYEHGLAYVSNVDGRGIFSVNGIFKRGEKASKLTNFYDLVNILCYVGGEIRDGFFVEKLTESELVPILERNFSMAVGKAILQSAPIEEAAKLLVLPCYEKAKARGVEDVDLFANKEVKRSFEFYERVSRFCPYSDKEEFIMAKGGSDIKKPFAHLDFRRPEFEAWWMEKSELEYLGCPLPPIPTNFPESGKLLLGGDSMIDFMSEASKQRTKMSMWKKKTLEKFSIPVNFERLSGISQHQALWYTWKGDLKMGITMLESAKTIYDDQIAERILNARIPVVDLFLSLTQIKLAKMGECEGQTNKVDWHLSKGHLCETCHASATKGRDDDDDDDDGDDSPRTWTLTCVDKEGKGKIGTDTTRTSLITALAVARKVKSKAEFKTCIEYNLKESLEIFLEHSFVNLYWKNKPTPPTTEALIGEAVVMFVDAIDCESFDTYEWAESCTVILEELMFKHCHEKLTEKAISDVGQLFKEAFKSQIVQNIQQVEELPQYSNLCDDKASLFQLSSVMMARAVAPSIASHFHFKWKTMTRVEKKEALSASFRDLLVATKKVYESYSMKEVSQCAKEEINSSQACSKKECVCQNLAKFQDYVIDLLSSGHNPVSFLSCSPEGTITLSDRLFLDSTGELIDDMISSNDMYIYEKIMETDNLKEFANCPRLACLCQFACCEMYTMLKVKVITDFKEITWTENALFETRCCAFCGQMASEDVTLMKCSACRAAVYCTRQCQKDDWWVAGHIWKCRTLKRP